MNVSGTLGIARFWIKEFHYKSCINLQCLLNTPDDRTLLYVWCRRIFLETLIVSQLVSKLPGHFRTLMQLMQRKHKTLIATKSAVTPCYFFSNIIRITLLSLIPTRAGNHFLTHYYSQMSVRIVYGTFVFPFTFSTYTRHAGLFYICIDSCNGPVRITQVWQNKNLLLFLKTCLQWTLATNIVLPASPSIPSQVLFTAITQQFLITFGREFVKCEKQ
jgi:hypothetical protein